MSGKVMKNGVLLISMVIAGAMASVQAYAAPVTFHAPIADPTPLPNIPKDQIVNMPLVTQQQQIVTKELGDLTLADLGNLAPASDSGTSSQGQYTNSTVVTIATVKTTSYSDTVIHTPTSLISFVGGETLAQPNTSLQTTINQLGGSTNTLVPNNYMVVAPVPMHMIEGGNGANFINISNYPGGGKFGSANFGALD